MTPPDSSEPTPARGSRAGRIARALTLGYTYQAIVAVTGLVLTPFLLRELGVTDYGRWLVVGQVLGLLGLLDLGVTGVLPREVARASGAASTEPVSEVVRRAWWLVWLQTPIVGLVAAGVWYGVSEARPELSGPLGLILGVFVLQFPLRVPAAVLNGLQDLTFGAGVQAFGWLVTTVVSVSLVFAGWGLFALAVGWSAGQLLSCLTCWVRLRSKFPIARRSPGWPGRTAIRGYLRPSIWTSVRQSAYVLANGTELIILGWVLGAQAVIVYSCTSKLVSFVANQPNLLLNHATPGLVELRTSGDLSRAWATCRAVALLMLLVSGGIGIVLLAANEAFVTHWVNPEVYGGPLLSLLIILAMWVRHWVYTLVIIQYVFGQDRWLAISAVLDGIVTFGAMLVLVATIGPFGVPLALIAGSAGVSGFMGLIVLSRQAGQSPSHLVFWFTPWILRLGLVGGIVAAATFLLPVEKVGVAIGVLTLGVMSYSMVARGLLARDPLKPYWARLVNSLPWRSVRT